MCFLYWQYSHFFAFSSILLFLSVSSTGWWGTEVLLNIMEASREKSPAYPLRCLFFLKCLKRKQVPGVFWKRLFPVESRDQTGIVFNPSYCDADTDTFSLTHTHWLHTNTHTDQMKRCVPDTDTNTPIGQTKPTNMQILQTSGLNHNAKMITALCHSFYISADALLLILTR